MVVLSHEECIRFLLGVHRHDRVLYENRSSGIFFESSPLLPSAFFPSRRLSSFSCVFVPDCGA